MTELVWDGKYGKDGKKTAPLRVALPFQTVETVNEGTADRQKTMSLFEQGRDTEWRNRLIWGDKKYVLPSLLPELAGQVHLIYIDPPFNVGADFSFTTQIPDSDQTLTKTPSVIEQKAYRDTWGKGGGLDPYLQWFYETASLLHELLAENGSIYVHLDDHVSHYAKVLLDEIFGVDNFLAEIIWKRYGAHGNSQKYGAVHDVIYYYGKDNNVTFNKQFVPYTEEYAADRFRLIDKNGRRYQEQNLSNPSPRPNLYYNYMASNGVTYQPHANGWKCDLERMKQLDREGRLHFPSDPNGRLRLKMFLDEAEGVPLQDVWTDMTLASSSEERLGYPTQKPEALLERILKASSNEGDLVLDCFCGSGTTAAVAERLGRRWITCDLGRFAIHTTRKRLLAFEGVKPFVVQNLGKYERQHWQAGLSSGAPAAHRAYVDFILGLYHAQPLHGHAWLHGLKSGRMVHVGSVDGPVSPGDVTHIVAEFRKAVGTGKNAPSTNGIDVLGWDFAFELHEVATQQAAAANVALKFVRIPRDVMDKRAVEAGDIRFFELGALSVDTAVKKLAVTLTLTEFVIPPDDVPQDVQAAIKHWEQWIDYWAIDWDYKGDTFHNQWQSYRTRKDKKLDKQAVHKYEAAGMYRILVKVIDILGNDTTKALTVKVS